jgi:PKD repeat protein
MRATHIVPVVFHVIHNNGAENISDAQILDAMRILNEDFNKENADWPGVKAEFLSLVADVGVEYRLARKDPQGNCTSGITRTVSTLTYQGDQAMKNLIQWPRNRYLNVWVAASAGGPNVGGYALLPGGAAFFPSGDGIVMNHTFVGSIGTGNPSRSRALTHEVGHWINLQHTWGGSNTPGLASNCNDDDGVADTPNTTGTQGCNLNSSSCNTLDNVENFMDYSFCFKMFTLGQKTRMIAALNSSTAQRNNLSTPANLTFTGVEGAPQLCAAAFSSNTNTICAGSQVTFSDESYHGVQTRTWSFPGGSPASSTDASPVVTYPEAGSYPVTLTVSDGSSNLSTTSMDHVLVLAVPGSAPPLSEGFESHASLNDSPWSVVNPSGTNPWSITEAAAYSGNKSIRIQNVANMAGQTNDIISGTIDMSGASAIQVNFRYAYAQRITSNDDRLKVYASNNCGQTWALRQQLRGINTLNTAGATVTGSFVPSGPGQWGYSEVGNIGSTYHVADFRLRFEFESAGGNFVYLDDININGAPVSVEEILLGGSNALMVVPNPAEGEAQVAFDLARHGQVRMDLVDVLGRQVMALHDGNMGSGLHRIDLPIGRLQSGMYLVRLVQGEQSRVARFTVK